MCILAVLLDVLYAQQTGLRTRLITLDVEVVARTPAAPPGCSTWTHPLCGGVKWLLRPVVPAPPQRVEEALQRNRTVTQNQMD